MRLVILALVVAATGCGVLNTCDHPDKQELSCQPLAADSTEPGCAGRPPQEPGASATHVDERYPLGCELTYPVCLGAYPNSPKRCFCQGFGAEPPQWACPI